MKTMNDRTLLRILKDTGFIVDDFRMIQAVEEIVLDDDATVICDPSIPLTLDIDEVA